VHLAIDLDLGNTAEDFVAFANFIRIPKRLQKQPVAAGFDCDHVIAAARCHLSKCDLSRIAQCFTYDRVALGSNLVVARDHVIRLFEEARIDFAMIDELHEFDGALAFEPDGIQLVLLDQYVFVIVDFVAFDDVLLIHRPYAGCDLLVSNALPGRFVYLVKRQLAGSGNGGKKLDTDGDQRQSYEPLPVSPH
jgi:hypothetical protein